MKFFSVNAESKSAVPTVVRTWNQLFWNLNLRASSHTAVGVYKLLASFTLLQITTGIVNLYIALPHATTQIYLRDTSIDRAWLETCTSSLYLILTHIVFALLFAHIIIQLWPIRENDTHPNPCPWYHTATISIILTTLTIPVTSLLLTIVHSPAWDAFVKTTERVVYTLSFGDGYKVIELDWSTQSIMYLHFILLPLSVISLLIIAYFFRSYTQNLLHWYSMYLPEGARIPNKTWYQKAYYWLKNIHAVKWFLALAILLIGTLVIATLDPNTHWQLSNPYWGYAYGSEPISPECAEVIFRLPWFYGPLITLTAIFKKQLLYLLSVLIGFLIVFKTPWSCLKRKGATAVFKRPGYRMKATWTSRIISTNMLGLFLLLCSPTSAPWFSYFIALPYLTTYMLGSLFIFILHRKFSLNKFVYYIWPFFKT